MSSHSVEPGPSWRTLLSSIGVEGPNCPYCGHEFERMPQRKRSCPSCSGVLYSRKRPLDGLKVLLTEEQAREGEGQSALLMLIQEDGLKDVDLDALVRSLQGQLGRLPTAEEVVAQQLMRVAATHAEAWRWGLFRNARFNLAESCIRRGLREEALRLYLEVCLLDLNGPRNCGTKDPQVTRRFPPFDPSTAFLAPGVVNRTKDVTADLELSLDDTHRVFEAVAVAVVPGLKLPRSSDDAWGELSKALYGSA